MGENLLGKLLVKIVGDKSDLDKALSESEKAAGKTGENIAGKLKSQFKEVDTALGGIGQKIATLLANPLVLAATAFVAVGKAAFDTTKQLVEYGDKIQTAADQTGLSTDSLQEYKFVAEQTSSSFEAITNSVKLMTRGLDTNADTYKRLGIQLKDSNGAFRSSNEIFDDTIGALSKVTNETERSKLALELFGRGAMEMVPLLNLGSGGMADLKTKAHDLGLVMREDTIKNADDLKDSLTALQGSWKAMTMGLMQDVLPALNKITGGLGDVFKLVHALSTISSNKEIFAGFKAGKKNVVEYHDALESMVDTQEALLRSNTLTALGQKLANNEIANAKKEIERIAPAYDIAAAAEARMAQNRKLNGLVIKTTTAAIVDNTAALADEANATAISQQIAENALKNRSEAMNAHAADVANATSVERTWYADGTQGAIEHAAALAKNKETVGEIVVHTKDLLSAEGEAYSPQVVAQINEINDKLLLMKKYSEMVAAGLSSGIVASFESLGAAFVNGDNPMKAFFKSFINMIGDTVLAFAALIEAQGWATFPIVDWVKVVKGVGLAVAGGAIKASAVSLASGGVASSPTLAMIGDNSRYPEVVSPLSPSFFAGIGEGILGALAARSSQAPAASSGSGGAVGLGMSSSDLDGFAAKVAARITVINHTDLDGKEIARSTSRYQGNNQVGRRR